MAKKGHLTINAQGVAAVGLENWLAENSGQWFPAQAPEGWLLFENHHDLGAAPQTGIRLVGTIMAQFELTDILGMIHRAKWEGSFHVRTESARKTLFLKQGDVVGAASTADEDRLGQLLRRHGVLTAAQLDEALRVGGLSRLGMTVVQRGLITAPQLYSFLRQQVEQIFYSLVFLGAGTYCFHERPLTGSSWEHLRLSTESLMLEGTRRVDEMRQLQARNKKQR